MNEKSDSEWRLKRVFRSFGKFLVIFLCFIITILLLSVVLMQFKSVRQFALNKVLNAVTSKTNSVITAHDLHFYFTGYVKIEGLYVEDLNSDTILYADAISIQLSLNELINGNIDIKSIELSAASAKIIKTDSLFNFSFIIESFATKETKVDTSVSKSSLKVDQIQMRDCRFLFKDNVSGTDISMILRELDLEIDSLDLAQLIFNLDALEISDATVSLNTIPSENIVDSVDNPLLPIFYINKTSLHNFVFSLSNKADSQKVFFSTTKSLVNSLSVNLNQNSFYVGNLNSTQSKIYLDNDKLVSGIEKIVDSAAIILPHLKIGKMILSDNEFRMTNASTRIENKKKFDPTNIRLKALNGEISDFNLSDDSLTVKITNLTTHLDKEKDVIQLIGTIKKTKDDVMFSKLDFSKGQTKLKGDLYAKFIVSGPENKVVLTGSDVDLKTVVIDQNDLVYFINDSLEKKYFLKPWPVVTMEINAHGNMKKMVMSKFNLNAGQFTSIQSNFVLTELDNPESMGFDIPDFKIKTSKIDLERMSISALIPSTLNLPELISIKASGIGKIKDFKLKSAIITSTGSINLNLSMQEKSVFNGDVSIVDFNIGRLLKMEEKVGKITMQLSFDGSGTGLKDVKSKINLNASSFVYNKYNYHDLSILGEIEGKSFSGVIMLNDTNAEFKVDGKIDINEGREMVNARIDIAGVNLQKLNFASENIRFSSNATIDFDGLKYDSLEGNLAVHNIIIVKNENIYRLDSLLFASVNDSTGNSTKMESSILTADFKGAFSPVNVVPEIKNLFNRYFPISDVPFTTNKNDFSFNISLRNHPVLKDVFLPKLEEFTTVEIKGNFNKKEDVFNASVKLPYLKYSDMKLENFSFAITSDSSSLKSYLGFKEISNEQFKIDSLIVNAILKDSVASISILNLFGEEKKISFSSTVRSSSVNDYLVLLPKSFILNNEEWSATGSDSVHLRKDLPITISMDIAKRDERIQIVRDEKGNGKVALNGFQIENIFQLISRDSSLASGSVDGEIVLADKALSGNIYLNDLKVRKYEIGDLHVEANQLSNGFTFKSTLEGKGNMANVTGSVSSADTVTTLDIVADLKAISMKSIEGVTMGSLSSSSGNISGTIKVSGVTTDPAVNGKLHFNNIETVPTAINSRFIIPNSTLEVSDKKLYLNKFAMKDSNGKLLTIDGIINLENITDPGLDINITSEEFELFNSPKAQKKMFYGRLIADSKIDISGSTKQPVIKSKLGIKKGTDFTFVIPESSNQFDRGGNEVVFKTDRLNQILTLGNTNEIGKSDVRNFSVEALLEIDKGAVLRIIPDPNSGDSLIVQGDAALSFGLDKTGRMSLTGSYELDDGSYVVSLENLVKKRFNIQKGSRIDWSGDPLTAEIDLRAMYEVRTSPADLLANEFAASSSANTEYKERLPFQVFLILKGDLKAPIITFEIQLPAGSRGALGGMVNEKLILLNNDPSELNKQVFALLVLNRFIQEDPLASSTNGSAAENAARSSVSRFLSNQLNKLSSEYISGVELNFDLQSYNDYGSNSGEGRTELAVGVKKNINDRISVQVGGTVEVEGARAKENSLADWTGDFTVEYKITEEGDYRLKGFRRNQYEGLVEGQLVETGVGLIFIKDFDLWNDLFKRDVVKPKNNESPEIK